MFLALAISTVLATSCSKEGQDCYWTDSFGNDWTEYPSNAEIQQMEDDCGCQVTFTKNCN